MISFLALVSVQGLFAKPLLDLQDATVMGNPATGYAVACEERPTRPPSRPLVVISPTGKIVVQRTLKPTQVLIGIDEKNQPVIETVPSGHISGSRVFGDVRVRLRHEKLAGMSGRVNGHLAQSQLFNSVPVPGRLMAVGSHGPKADHLVVFSGEGLKTQRQVNLTYEGQPVSLVHYDRSMVALSDAEALVFIEGDDSEKNELDYLPRFGAAESWVERTRFTKRLALVSLTTGECKPLAVFEDALTAAQILEATIDKLALLGKNHLLVAHGDRLLNVDLKQLRANRERFSPDF